MNHRHSSLSQAAPASHNALFEPLEARRLLSAIYLDHKTLVVEGNGRSFNRILVTTDAHKTNLFFVTINGHTAAFDLLQQEINTVEVFGGNAGNYIADVPGIGLQKFLLNTTLIGGSGNDTLIGGSATDLLIGGGGNDNLQGGTGSDSIIAGDGQDTVAGDGDDFIITGNGNDVISGGQGNAVIFAGNGNDTISGGNGHNELIGGSGNNLIRGGTDVDTIYGGGGRDTIIPGSGNESIHYGALSSCAKIIGELTPRIPTVENPNP